MKFKKIECDYEILFNIHEFPTPNGMLKVSTGDSLVIDKTTPIDILGYGVLVNDYSLKMFFYLEKDVYYYEIFELAELLLMQEIVFTVFIDSENNKYFNERIVKIFNVSKLEDVLSGLKGISIKGRGGRGTNKKYVLENQIGKPDWTVLFKYNTNGGGYSLGKVSSLTKEYPGKVFLQCHNIRNSKDFTNSFSVFFSLSGVDVTPNQCVMSLSFFN